MAGPTSGFARATPLKNDKKELYTTWASCAACIVSFLKALKQHNISIDEAIVAYDEHIASLAQAMRPASVVAAARNAKPGLLRCPSCGAALETKQLCPHVSPRIRTQLACTNDKCSWWGQSEHNVAWLIQHGINDVERG